MKTKLKGWKGGVQDREEYKQINHSDSASRDIKMRISLEKAGASYEAALQANTLYLL